jgi:hypothetical protein
LRVYSCWSRQARMQPFVIADVAATQPV